MRIKAFEYLRFGLSVGGAHATSAEWLDPAEWKRWFRGGGAGDGEMVPGGIFKSMGKSIAGEHG